MLKKHTELLDLLKKAEKLAVDIETNGGNVQATIHRLRASADNVHSRVQAYKAQAAEEEEAAEKEAAEKEAAPQK